MTWPTFPKPTPTKKRPNRTVSKARAVRRHKHVSHERAEKAKVRLRDDNRCRYRDCADPFNRVEVAHLQHKGMGGNPKGDRSMANQMLCLCRYHHRDPEWSYDSGELLITPKDKQLGTDGECDLRWKDGYV